MNKITATDKARGSATGRGVHGDDADGDADGAEDNFTPLTREQAQQLRSSLTPVNPWRVLGWQSMVGAALTLLAWWVTGKSNVALSALYGAVAVVVPGAVFARGLSSRLVRVNAGSAVTGFLVWEMVKIALTVAMLFAAPKVVEALSWPALLLGLIVTMKVYWLGLRVKRKPLQA